MNSNQEWQHGPQRLKPVGPTTCGFCEATFASTDALRAHKLKSIKAESEDPNLKQLHLYCRICDKDFHTTGGAVEHMRLVCQDTCALHGARSRDSDSNFAPRCTLTSKTSNALPAP